MCRKIRINHQDPLIPGLIHGHGSRSPLPKSRDAPAPPDSLNFDVLYKVTTQCHAIPELILNFTLVS